MKRLVFSLLLFGCCLANAEVVGQRKELPRTWKDVTGEFNIQAKLVSAQGGNVVLLRANNQEMTIPLEGLSLADQQYAKNPAVPNNLKCVDLSDMKGDLPLVAVSTKQILRRSEPWEYSTWKVEARKDDTVGYPSVVRNDRESSRHRIETFTAEFAGERLGFGYQDRNQPVAVRSGVSRGQVDVGSQGTEERAP